MLAPNDISVSDQTIRKNWPFLLGVIIRYLLSFAGSSAIWYFVGSGPGKIKYQGIVMGGIAAYLAIQEAFFQLSRGKINESLNSPAIDLPELEILHDRVIRTKAYLDKLWKITVPAKFIAIVCGLTLANGGAAGDAFVIAHKTITWNAIVGTLGWFSIFIGVDLTWRTFAIFRHIDAFNTTLSVKSKEILAQREVAKKLRDADPGGSWSEDPTPNGYSRIRLKHP